MSQTTSAHAWVAVLKRRPPALAIVLAVIGIVAVVFGILYLADGNSGRLRGSHRFDWL
jgi:hypothetical protein